MKRETTSKARARLERAAEWVVRHRAEVLATATTMALAAPAPAWAIDGVAMLKNIVDLLKGGLGFGGGALVVWGAVQVGTNLSNGANGNSASIAQGVYCIIGGLVIMGAAIFFSQLDTGWFKTE